ncbi:Hypothetical_protein [Hexamita inflata]|uniref:Hypothetical_protein n=1 Tax=Hexamita inflata TaxID=28002 RepID=A0AA86PS76_9EUKA|nr:Hypothetical protein HINF_LOCUS32854 [Hexamita inflata]
MTSRSLVARSDSRISSIASASMMSMQSYLSFASASWVSVMEASRKGPQFAEGIIHCLKIRYQQNFGISYFYNALIEQLFQQVCGRRLIELRGLFYVINFVETKQCQACQYFHFAPNKNNANNE